MDRIFKWFKKTLNIEFILLVASNYNIFYITINQPTELLGDGSKIIKGRHMLHSLYLSRIHKSGFRAHEESIAICLGTY